MTADGSATQRFTRATVFDALLGALSGMSACNHDDMVAPAAILWADEDRQWLALVPRLRQRLAHFLTFGDHDPATQTGPAIWLRCMLGRSLPEATWAPEVVPVIYLPGVSRQALRAVESCPPPLRPLVELQFRGVVWTQQNGKDWTLAAFLQTKNGGLGLEVARDDATAEALLRAAVRLADMPVDQLRNKRLDAEFFNSLMTEDPVRDLLTWLNDPKEVRGRMDDAGWGSFRAVCKQKYKFDPEKDGELTAGESLGVKGQGRGHWAHVWRRFQEAPTLYPNLKELLRRARPKTAPSMFDADAPVWPQDNEGLEDSLRKDLVEVGKKPPTVARKGIAELEKQHGARRACVWSKLGDSPLAGALEFLAVLALATERTLGGSTPEAMAEQYAEWGWKADAAVLDALAIVRKPADVVAVRTAVCGMYRTWLEDGAEQLQKVAENSAALPCATPSGKPEDLPKGCCVLFADGLRFDVGQKVVAALESAGVKVDRGRRWAAMPTVTPTAKPAASPIAGLLSNSSLGDEFRPTIAATGKELTSDRFKQLLGEATIQVLGANEGGDPEGRAWTEYGSLDRMGHDQGWKLAWRIEEEVEGLAARIRGLLEAGWREVRVVTDHGWLLLPGGLPKVELPKFLTETRWGRCATLKKTATPDAVTVPWTWSAEHRVAVARGIACFKHGTEYTHGGLSVQECVVPSLVVRAAARKEGRISIKSIAWKRLVCKVVVEGEPLGHSADLRGKAADPGTSLLADPEERKARPVGTDGAATLFADDTHQGAAAVVVLLDAEGRVVAKEPTTVGGEE